MKKKRFHKSLPLNPNAAAFNTKHGAEYIGVSENSLKISRNTGELCGQPPPEYKKADRKVIYLKSVLDSWLVQLPSLSNTAQSGRAG
jgi:hypothetical protein